MTDIETLNARIETLEIAKAHQDRAVEDLSEALAAQWKQIETLNRQVALLTEQVREAQEANAGAGGGETADEPPHY